ncbi:hypothetical protein [Paenibacillus ginsengarvi]|uniref:hypothetical protein n=1 Tax=Paenibacillus ginsengarvi TaxID=400777 RepID=UPI0013155293|nr:hypothetical protein [Paenibacillus ginsengarvi]
METNDIRQKAVRRDIREDVEAHERLGMLVDDDGGEPVDMEPDGRINTNPDSAPL